MITFYLQMESLTSQLRRTIVMVVSQWKALMVSQSCPQLRGKKYFFFSLLKKNTAFHLEVSFCIKHMACLQSPLWHCNYYRHVCCTLDCNSESEALKLVLSLNTRCLFYVSLFFRGSLKNEHCRIITWHKNKLQ